MYSNRKHSFNFTIFKNITAPKLLNGNVCIEKKHLKTLSLIAYTQCEVTAIQVVDIKGLCCTW